MIVMRWCEYSCPVVNVRDKFGTFDAFLITKRPGVCSSTPHTEMSRHTVTANIRTRTPGRPLCLYGALVSLFVCYTLCVLHKPGVR